jgi:seryl-tRNA synthetase
MLDLSIIREHPERVRGAIRDKGAGREDIVEELLEVDRTRREHLSELQQLQARSNDVSRQIGTIMRDGRKSEAQDLITESAEIKKNIQQLEDAVREIDIRLDGLLLEIPNIPHPSVPVGRTAEENRLVSEHGDPPPFDFEPRTHWDLATDLGIVDFERGARVVGAGFPFYVGAGARLQRALISYFLDLAVNEGGYREIQPPLLVNAASATGTGQLPDKEDMMYEVSRDKLYLIPTAEVPVTNFFRDEILSEDDLPVKFCAYTPCFRREAGSYGKHVRGLNRLHQFDKVELVQFVRPEESYEALESMTGDAERALEHLGLPYRRLLMCTGDMGFSQAKKYDLEVWSAGQQRWLEVSSISNLEAFQARRTRTRFRPTGGKKPEFVHTLNGSALALPRTVAAILENFQLENGTVAVPPVLKPYFGGDAIA